MLCRESKKILGAYVDNEVDLLTGLALEDHLSICTDCAHDLENQRSLKLLLGNADLRFPSPSGLRQAILKSLGSQQRTSGILRWPGMPFAALIAATTALVLFLTTSLFVYNRQNHNQVLDQVVDDHIRSLLVNHLADVPSSDQHTVKPWFNGKINFSPKVQDFSDKGFPLIGGRLDYMENQTVSVLVYERRLHVINVFNLPNSTELRPVTNQKRGYNLIHWAADGMEYWVVSDLNAGELQEFASLLRQ